MLPEYSSHDPSDPVVAALTTIRGDVCWFQYDAAAAFVLPRSVVAVLAHACQPWPVRVGAQLGRDAVTPQLLEMMLGLWDPTGTSLLWSLTAAFHAARRLQPDPTRP